MVNEMQKERQAIIFTGIHHDENNISYGNIYIYIYIYIYKGKATERNIRYKWLGSSTIRSATFEKNK